MKLIYFSSQEVAAEKELREVLFSLVDAVQEDLCRTPDQVKNHLNQPGADICVAVLVIADRRELNEFYFMQDILCCYLEMLEG